MQKHEDEKIPEESEHCKDKSCCCSPSSRTLCLSFICYRRFRSLRSLHQRLWIFALFEDGFVVISVQNMNVLKRCVFFSF